MFSRIIAAPRAPRVLLLLAALSSATSLLAADTPAAAPAPARPAASAPASPAARVDLNLASEADLEALPKVGPATAKRIVDYRKQVGTIKSVDELVNVQGIGPKTLELIRPHVTVGTAVPAPSPARKP